MADNSLDDVVDGNIAVAEDINKVIAALKETQYPRAPSGATANEAGSLGDVVKRFLALHVKDIIASSINVGSINENVGLNKTEIPYSVTDQFIVPAGITKIYIEIQAGGGAGGDGLDDSAGLKFLGAGGGGGGYLYFSQAVEEGDIIGLDFSTAKDINIDKTSGAVSGPLASAYGGSDGLGFSHYGGSFFGLYRNGVGGGVALSQSGGATSLTSSAGGNGGMGGTWQLSAPNQLMPSNGFYGTKVSSPTLLGGDGGIGGNSGTTTSVNGVDGNTLGFVVQARRAYISYWS